MVDAGLAKSEKNHRLLGVAGILLSISLCTFGVGVWASNMHAVAADGFPQEEVATVHGLAGSAGAVGGVLFNTVVGYLSMQGDFFFAFVILVALQPLGVGALWIWLPERETSPLGAANHTA